MPNSASSLLSRCAELCEQRRGSVTWKHNRLAGIAAISGRSGPRRGTASCGSVSLRDRTRKRAQSRRRAQPQQRPSRAVALLPTSQTFLERSLPALLPIARRRSPIVRRRGARPVIQHWSGGEGDEWAQMLATTTSYTPSGRCRVDRPPVRSRSRSPVYPSCLMARSLQRDRRQADPAFIFGTVAVGVREHRLDAVVLVSLISSKFPTSGFVYLRLRNNLGEQRNRRRGSAPAAAFLVFVGRHAPQRVDGRRLVVL